MCIRHIPPYFDDLVLWLSAEPNECKHDMNGTENTYDGGEDPKHKVLRVSFSKVGDEKSARVEHSVQKNTDPQVV